MVENTLSDTDFILILSIGGGGLLLLNFIVALLVIRECKRRKKIKKQIKIDLARSQQGKEPDRPQARDMNQIEMSDFKRVDEIRQVDPDGRSNSAYSGDSDSTVSVDQKL